MKSELVLPGPTVVSDKAYRFVRPLDSRFWPWFFAPIVPRHLRRKHGVESWRISGAHHVEASLEAGHGVMIVPNHPTPGDPVVLALASRALQRNFHVMASAHLFLQSRWKRWLLPRLGVFSVYREGMDRRSLKAATEILAGARRPLVIFGEGVITLTNDRLAPMQEGLSFIAKAAARLRAERVEGGQVVVHPLALRYHFRGDVDALLGPPLDYIECRLSWQPQRDLGSRDRVMKVGHALLALREVEYFGAPNTGTIDQRLDMLLERVMAPVEAEWTCQRSGLSVVQRVKAARKAILPDLIAGKLAQDERARRWRQLFDLQIAEQIFHFPPDYLAGDPPPERLIETVRRYAEAIGEPDFFVPRPMSVSMEFGEAIRVTPDRDRRAATDPLIEQVEDSLRRLLGLQCEAAR